MYFKQNDTSLCTVGKMAERLGSFKQKVSKLLIQLEREGLVDRKNNRHPVLTETGLKLASNYAIKMKMTMENLLAEGVSLECAEKDAYNIVLLASDSTMDAIKRKYIAHKIRQEVIGENNFDGNSICKLLSDGMYPLDFVIYRQHPEHNKLLSMANSGFEHPGYLFIDKGIGKIKLKIKDLHARAPYKEGMVKGQAAEVHYLVNEHYVKAELLGSFISFPMEAINFKNIGENKSTRIHGSLFIKIKSTVNTTYMPESEAIFTVII